MSVFNMADGYVRLKLWGNGVERFVVLCSHQKMPLWDIEAQGKYVFTNMRLKDFYNCKKRFGAYSRILCAFVKRPRGIKRS